MPRKVVRLVIEELGSNKTCFQILVNLIKWEGLFLWDGKYCGNASFLDFDGISLLPIFDYFFEKIGWDEGPFQVDYFKYK